MRTRARSMEGGWDSREGCASRDVRSASMDGRPLLDSRLPSVDGRLPSKDALSFRLRPALLPRLVFLSCAGW